MFSGVLGGLGEFFNINPLFLRIIYLILALNSFTTMVIIYIIFTAIIPLADNNSETSNGNMGSNSSLLGISLIFIGIILLFNNLFPIYFPQVLSLIRTYSEKLIDLWPTLLVVLGIYVLVDAFDKSK